MLETAARNRSEAQQRKSQEPAPLGMPIVAEIAGMLEGLADPVHGGYGTKNKFLHTEANDFCSTCLRPPAQLISTMWHDAGQDAGKPHLRPQRWWLLSLLVKPDWQDPQPEKLLDDQATLIRNYLYTYLLSEQAYKEMAEGLMDYLNTTVTTLRSPVSGAARITSGQSCPCPQAHPPARRLYSRCSISMSIATPMPEPPHPISMRGGSWGGTTAAREPSTS